MSDPLLPIRTNKDVESAYIKLSLSDFVINEFETSTEKTISDIICPDIKGINDHNVVSSPNDSVCAMTASWNGSNSSYWNVVRRLLVERGEDKSLTATEDAGGQLGIITLRKEFYDLGISSGTLSATVTGVNFSAQSIADTYYDDGNGSFIRQGTGDVVGKVYNDDGFIVVTSADMREVATSITDITYKTNVNHNSINVFCKCPPDKFNFTLNHTAASTASLYYAGIPDSYDNIYTNSTLTGSTERFVFWEDLVLSGYAFSPTITSVGLYNDDNDLLAVAKLANAIKKPTDLPITIKVSIDI